MKKHHLLLSTFIFSTLFGNAFAQNSWYDQLNRLSQFGLPNAQVGVMVIDADTGKPLFNYDGNKSFTPASTMKLFSGAAALKYLGGDYRYDTTASINRLQLKNGVLQGNLYIRFSGDPSLTTQNLQQIIAGVRQYGITTIEGNVIVDASRFQAPNHAPGWSNDTINWAYSAPITSVILDGNIFTVKFIPSKTIGQPVIVEAGKNMQFMQIQSTLKTVTYAQSMHDCSLVMDIDNQNTLHLAGCWPMSLGGWKAMAVPNPVLLAEKVIQQSLYQQHINVNGQILLGKQPLNLYEVYDHQSAPLYQLLKHMLKKSDNIYAGSVTKTLGSATVGQGTFQQGVNAIKQILGPMAHVNFGNTVISDGSGQSHYDLITPQQFTQLLFAIYHTPALQTNFMEALPIAGIDGTLKFRMGNDKALVGKVHAKTGSMKGISTLAGYLTTASGHKVIFAIMVNGIAGKLGTARVLEDKMCAAMYQI